MRCIILGLLCASAGVARAADEGASPAAAAPSTSAATSATDAAANASVERLLAALTKEDSYKVRLQAAVLLGRIGDERAVQPLIDAVNSDPHYTVRGAAATALANRKETRAIAPILKRLAVDPEPFVREAAGKALASFERQVALPYIVTSFNSSDARVRKEAITYIALEPSALVDPVLAKGLGDVPEIAEIAGDAVRKLPPGEMLRFLEGALENREPGVRRGAIHMLHKLGSAEATQLVLRVYERDIEEDDVKSAARIALRELRNHLPLEQIQRDAASSVEKHTRVRALRLLGVAGGAEAEKTLLAALQDDDPYIRGNAVMALGELGDPALVPALEKLMDDPSNQRILHLVRHTLKQLRSQRDQSVR